MNHSSWKQLNTMPKFFRMKTYPELKELCRLKFAAEKAKNINRTIKDAMILFKNDDDINAKFNAHPDSTYGTASGSGYLNATDAKQLMKQTLMWADMDFASFYITIWVPESKLWVSIKDI